MSESMNNEQTILAEVTKTRVCLENTLNNAEPNSKPVKVHTPAKKGAKAAAHKSHHQQSQQAGAPKPWSSMSVEDLAILVRNQEADDDEDTIMPSRRRAPVKGATFTSHTVPNSPTMAQPNNTTVTTVTQKSPMTPANHGARTTGNSPVNFFSAPPVPQQNARKPKVHSQAHQPLISQHQQQQQQQHFQQQQSVAYQFPTQPALPTFEQSVQRSVPKTTGGSATPPSMSHQTSQEFVAVPQQQQQQEASQEPFLVSFYRNEPYAFNVLGDNQTVEAAAGSMPAYKGFVFQNTATGSQLHNLSYSSENSEGNTSVGYVNSAEVSPIKEQQQHQSTSSYLSSPLMQPSNSFSSYSVPSTPTTANNTTASSSTKKRVYVNGRPVITQ